MKESSKIESGWTVPNSQLESMAVVNESFALVNTASSESVEAKGRVRSGMVEKVSSGKTSCDGG